MSCSNCESNPCRCGVRPCGSCHRNPCNCDCPTNTAACESLPSQIENFTKQFFGTVVKTEVDGVVSWTLPCDLEVGLVNNPRLPDEGVACYFKRLFEQGIIGLTGPAGTDGATGATGNNGYSVTLAAFTQPSTGSPNVQVVTAYNPAIVAGLQIFIETSGYYLITATDNAGTLFLTLLQAAAGAPTTITAGKIVVPSGPPGASGFTGPAGPQGASIQGPQGDTGAQGAAGAQGIPGENFTDNNGQFYVTDGTDVSLGLTYVAVDFTSGIVQVVLINQGTYLLTAVVGLLGKVGVAVAHVVSVKLQDDTLVADVQASEQTQSNIVNTEQTQIVINTIYTTDGPNHVIGLYAKCTSAAKVDAVALRTVLSFTQLA